MQRKNIIPEPFLELIINRLCHQLIEKHEVFANSVIIGVQPKGAFVAKRIQTTLERIIQKNVPLGLLDITFFRDDFRKRDKPITANSTKIDFLVEEKKVILVDDVLYTGRTIRAALDAMLAFGRPQSVDLLVLIDRIYSRNLPIEANFVGKSVNTMYSERVKVELREQGHQQDNIWLVETN
ncbi:MAG: bifunctional pyr operon transcriptional regulator/uracil phosphoribosyltransferase PyrR [Thermonemataceae bacterium]|nr:bifunctional pyr operon transcriptional regulator/uracil phosphoribosyltransferase PyrR [Thermonemataceae bacterium]